MNQSHAAICLFLVALATSQVAVAAGETRSACTARAVDEKPYTQGGLVEIEADASQAETSPRRITFSGDVDMRQNSRRLTADEIVYNQDTDKVNARGNIRMIQPGLVLSGEEARLDLTTDRAKLQPLQYELPAIGGRGDAEEGESEGEGKLRAKQITFTTCRPGDDDWMLKAKKLTVDRNKGLAEGRNATLRFKGVPLFASPWFQFPIDDRRLSGFMFPTGGYSSRNGIDFSLPYYFNLAPNYDATVIPRIITKRGLLLGGEFRYLFGGHRGRVFGEVIADDRLYEGDDNTRGGLQVYHTSAFTKRLHGKLRYSTVSDDQFLEDFGGDLGISSTRYITNLAELVYHGDSWNTAARWTQQDVLRGFDEPLTRLPQLTFSTRQPISESVWLDLDAEYVNFERDPGPTAQRIDILPAITADFRKPWGYVRPRLSARYTGYEVSFEDQKEIDDNPYLTDNPSRNLYSFSLDSGLFFEKEANWWGAGGIQTLEPRAFYLYTPYEDQDDQPIFDSAIPDLSYPNLFRENRFTGSDRVGDANQLSLGVTSRFIEKDSLRERFHASIGQIYYFDDRKVQLEPGLPNQTRSVSPLVSELDLTLSDEWSTLAVFQWDFEEDRAENSLLRLRYRSRDDHEIVSFAYRWDPAHDQEYTDLSFDWSINPNYRVVGRWQHSLTHDDLVEALAGIEYDSCCWRIRGAIRRYLATSDGEYDNAFFIQMELKGLGQVGDNIDSLLQRTLYDYQPFDP